MKNIQIILNAILSQDVFEYILIDRNYLVTNASEGVEKYIGAMPEIGHDVMDYLSELIGYEEQIDSVVNNKEARYILETIHKDSYYINLHLEHYDDDIVMILLHNTTEITLSKLELLQYSNENVLLYNTIQKILDSQNNLLFVTSGERIEYSNKKFMEYFSIKEMKYVKDRRVHNFEFFSPSVKSFKELYEYAKDEEKKISIREDTFLIRATPLEKSYKLFTLSNITNLNNLNIALESRINIDPLTGAYRKQYFDKLLEEELEKENDFILVVVDLDNFKMINDEYGHMAGDKALQQFTKLVKNELRSNDPFARWGGEEFLIMIQCTDRQRMIKKVEGIRKIVETYHFNTIGHITASFGIAATQAGDSSSTILQRADFALYEAKKLGKNRVVSG